MNVLFDFVHPADVNLFTNVIRHMQLKHPEYNLFITYRDRGILGKLLHSEIHGLQIVKMGQHQKTFLKKLLHLFLREFMFIPFLIRNRIDLSVNQGACNILACRLLGIPFILFEDDYEYKMAFYYAKLFATRDIMPEFIPGKGANVVKYRGCKELAHLHPDYYNYPDDILDEYNLRGSRYVFIREIANISVNYYNRKDYLVDVLNHIIDKGLTPVISSERDIADLPKQCIKLDKVGGGYFALIKNALFVISSGDTVAREASVLGVPVIYSGGRSMLANDMFINMGIIRKCDSLSDIMREIDNISDHKQNTLMNYSELIEKKIRNDWDDLNQVIYRQIMSFKPRWKK
jgi:predicted glycosyltransferase